MAFRERREENGLVWWEDEGLSRTGDVAHGFSTRLGGVSRGVYASLNLGHTRGDDLQAVRENYSRFCRATGAGEISNLVLSHQVHGSEIRVCTLADRGKGLDRERDYEVDGLMTDVPGLILTVFTADCIPLLFYDPVRRVAAASHAGWRGTAQAIAVRTVRRMGEVYGSQPEDIRAAIGPGIGPCCFLTHDDVTRAMENALGGLVAPFIRPAADGRFHVDLRGINRALLLDCGVARVDVCPDCTGCHPEKYWSHRITGPARGSMAAIIAIR
ncbi:MAG: peptidoglycan editing factor PgeF [Clostridiales bacterium]|nr:peptidoglycan editing factor PgeF [Clostridiales bacterium]